MDQNTLMGLMALRDAFGGLSAAGGGNPGPQNALPQILKMKQEQERFNKAREAYAQAGQGGGLPAGFDTPAMQAFAAQNPRQALSMAAKASLPAPAAKAPASVQEYEFAQGQGFQGSYTDWVRAKAEAGSTRISNSINTADGDAFKYGTIEPGYRVNRLTGVAEPVPGSSAARKAAEAQRGATESKENEVNTAQQMIDSIDAIMNDKALPYSTGVFAPLQKIPGTGSYRFGTKSRQLQGQAFLQAIESLKGTGQITEIEGKKAAEAVGRLDPGMAEEDYRASLRELKGFLTEVQGRAIQGGVSPRANPNFNSVPLNTLSDADLDARIKALQNQ